LSFSDAVELYPKHVSKDAKTGKEVTDWLNKYFVMWGDTKLGDGQMRDVRLFLKMFLKLKNGW